MRSGMRGKHMEGIYEWIKNLVCYLIFTTMIGHMIPDKKYEKYLRLFVGMVFLLLLVSPLADLCGLEYQVTEAFARLTFQNEATTLKREIEVVDEERFQRVIETYEEVIKAEIHQIATDLGMICQQVEVRLESDDSKDTFGRIQQIEILVLNGEKEGELRSRIGEYYGVEEGNIDIRLQTE